MESSAAADTIGQSCDGRRRDAKALSYSELAARRRQGGDSGLADNDRRLMLLAEALAAKKDALTEANDLRDRLAAAVIQYEDQEKASEDPATLVGKLSDALDRFERLTIQINRTNNETRLTFDGREMSIMEAVALRDRPTIEVKAPRAAVEAVEEGLETGKTSKKRPAYYQQAARRSKDDVRMVPRIDVAAERRVADELSERVRRLDLALQQRNWATELVE